MSRSDRRGPGRAAFTLLEVMAAIAVLALVYTVLARVGIQGFRAEGEADRRMRAALVADDKMTEIEGQLALGQALPVGENEVEQDDFVIRVRVSAADLTLPAAPENVERRQREGKLPAGSDLAKRTVGPAGPAPSFFLPAGAGQPPPGRHVEVKVAWTEGTVETSVVRETYGLDATAAQPLLIALDDAEKAAKEGKEGKAAQPDDAKKRDAADRPEDAQPQAPTPQAPPFQPGADPGDNP
jgi:prepilin-type N-terminal cleavage/methylation domain-containing protein